MKYPRVVINLQKIQDNTRLAVDLCHKHGISLMGVTKACLGSPEVAGAIMAGGADLIGDSRIENLLRLRESGTNVHLVMLRLPMKSEAKAVVRLADASLNSSVDTIRRLSEAATKAGLRHGIILMVDTGDGREGMRAIDIGLAAEEVKSLPGLYLAGIGTNVACLTGSLPTLENLRILTGAARTVAESGNDQRFIISGGNSSAWDLLQSGSLPNEVNELRLGEAILLGKETAGGKLIPGMHYDAFVIEAEIIESILSRPGHHLAAIGTQDIDSNALAPVDTSWRVMKASSDHLVLHKDNQRFLAGQTAAFIPGYTSLLRAMTSPFVEKHYV